MDGDARHKRGLDREGHSLLSNRITMGVSKIDKIVADTFCK